MSDIRQFLGSPIKSIQYGSITIGTVGTFTTATVTAVDVNKAVLMHLGTRPASGGTLDNSFATLGLTNSTTVRAERSSSGTNLIVNFVLVEYY